MTTVTTVVHGGWVEVVSEPVTAVVEAGERHVEALTEAAAGGLEDLLEALTAHGLGSAPAFAAVAPTADGVRVVVRGGAEVRLADGRTVGDGSRRPWHDLDVASGVAGDEVSLVTPDPGPPRGWRRPARLARGDAQPVVLQAEDDGAELEVAEPEPEVAEPEPAAPPDLTLPPPADASGLPPVARVPASTPRPSTVIDSVPWRRAPGTSPTQGLPAVSPATAAPEEPADPGAADPVEQGGAAEPAEAAQPGEPEGGEPAGAGEPEGGDPASTVVPDHPDEAPSPTPEVTTARGALPTEADLDRPLVLAVICPAGHHSQPHSGHCRSCGRGIPPQQPVQVPRPALGVLRVSTGGVVPLDRGVLLGRAPRVNEELPANQRPHLIRVGGVERDISRNHAEVLLEGWHVLVRDLGSTNGTTVALPGEQPVRLRPTEDQGIEPGTVITLADEVSLTYEVEE